MASIQDWAKGFMGSPVVQGFINTVNTINEGMEKYGGTVNGTYQSGEKYLAGYGKIIENAVIRSNTFARFGYLPTANRITVSPKTTAQTVKDKIINFLTNLKWWLWHNKILIGIGALIVGLLFYYGVI